MPIRVAREAAKIGFPLDRGFNGGRGHVVVPKPEHGNINT